jgi:tRNA (Thr-GGU) A37 N-methylase
MLGDKGLKAKVRPPRLGGARVGLFSTRTPHRPNPIGTPPPHTSSIIAVIIITIILIIALFILFVMALLVVFVLLLSFFRAGLTIAKIERLERGVLHISGVDLVDGTPVLDIKPYLPRYDSLPHAAGVARAQPTNDPRAPTNRSLTNHVWACAVPDWIDDEGATVREDAGKELHTGSIRSVHWVRSSNPPPRCALC